ncbi:hypothetical protein QJS10_CPB15g02179 [Acorus calamus]|uniref:Uncharacterized protein n=1 Tax=Acorus calamus TaxID=4465 RepID=A0AAV9D9N0_ACOCL|nr:hypothetical protein QJS10_CPB15g02179 [Acorus calamus]
MVLGDSGVGKNKEEDKSEPFIRPGRVTHSFKSRSLPSISHTYRDKEKWRRDGGLGRRKLSIEGIGIPDLARRLRESIEKGRVVSGPISRRRSTGESLALRDDRFESECFQQTEESKQFRQEYEMRKMKQQE